MITRTRIKEVVCGDFLHVYALPVTAPPKSTRKKSFKPTRESMAIYNEQSLHIQTLTNLYIKVNYGLH